MFLFTVFSITLAQNIKVQELSQGLLQRLIDLQIAVNEWKVMIMIEDMSTQWNEVMRVVTSLSTVNTSTMNPWCKNQMRLPQHRVFHLSRSHYHYIRRCGLMDGIGKLVHYFTGLATDEQVNNLHAKIEENEQFQREMSVWTEDYVLV